MRQSYNYRAPFPEKATGWKQHASAVLVFITLIAPLTPVNALASVFLDYQGPNFNEFELVKFGTQPDPAEVYQTSDRITDFFEFAAPFSASSVPGDVTSLVVDFSFNDGMNTGSSSC